MAWRDELRPASFRGVPFHVTATTGQGGRRGPLHEYPFRDDPFFEDLGLRARRHEISAFVLGPDYFAARDALLGALEKSGPGTLVHPYLGTLEVACTEFRVVETTREGGLARFQITFVRAGARRQPAAALDTSRVVEDEASAARAAVESVLAGGWDIAGAAQWVVDAAIARIREVSDALLDASKAVSEIEGDPAQFTLDAEALGSDADALVTDPATLGARIGALVKDLGAAGRTGRESLRLVGALHLFGSSWRTLLGGTEAAKANANQDLLRSLVRRQAAIAAAAAVPRVELVALQELSALREDIAGLLDGEISVAGATGDDVGHRALSDLLVAVTTDLRDRAVGLARIVDFEPTAPTQALSLAYRLYADTGRAQEIIDRNGVAHPGFLPRGVPVQVLSA